MFSNSEVGTIRGNTTVISGGGGVYGGKIGSHQYLLGPESKVKG